MPYKDKAKQREYMRKYMKRKRASGEYTTLFRQWVKKRLKENPSNDVSFSAFMQHVEMEKLERIETEKAYKEADKYWGKWAKPTEQPKEPLEPIRGANIFHGAEPIRHCSECGLPMESDEGLNDNVCDECKINALIG